MIAALPSAALSRPVVRTAGRSALAPSRTMLVTKAAVAKKPVIVSKPKTAPVPVIVAKIASKPPTPTSSVIVALSPKPVVATLPPSLITPAKTPQTPGVAASLPAGIAPLGVPAPVTLLPTRPATIPDGPSSSPAPSFVADPGGSWPSPPDNVESTRKLSDAGEAAAPVSSSSSSSTMLVAVGLAAAAGLAFVLLRRR